MKLRAAYVVLLALAIPWVAWNGLTSQINAAALDLLMRFRGAGDSRTAGDIVLVAIDDATARRYGPLPLDRRLLARGLERLATAGPDVVALDVLIAEAEDPEAEAAIAKALGAVPSVVAAAIESDPGKAPRWIEPLPDLAAAAQVGHAHADPDPDGVVRSVLLAKAAGGRRRWALALEAAALALQAGRPVETADQVRLGSIRIPAKADNGRLLCINYAGPEGVFERISFAALLDGSVDPARFRGKIVIVGATAQGAGDRHFTPVSAGIGMSGIEIHANILRTILDEAFLLPPSPLVEIALYLLTAVACVAAGAKLRGLPLAGALAGVLLLIFVACYAAFARGALWPPASMAAVFLLSSGVAVAGEYASVHWAWRRSEEKRREYAFRVQAIAHEIKNPLAAIQGSSEMIEDESLPPEMRQRMAGLIHKESKRLATLIRTFLDVERMASGTLEIEKKPVELSGLCREVVERARLYAARKRTKIEMDAPRIEAAADPDLLGFAIYNLLTNAVKYSPKRSTVRLAVRETAGGVAISVTDEGYGIAREEQQKIFERFYRLKRDEKGGEEGTGIGLALVKEIATQHGGRVEVESSPGAGSRFTLVLPKS